MLKKAVSKAAADESTGGVTLLTHPKLPRQLVLRVGYAEHACEARTKLADFFSFLLCFAQRTATLFSSPGLLHGR